MPKYVDNVQMARIVIRVPDTALAELEKIANESGMYSQHFYQAAIICGARLLAQIFHNRVELQSLGFEDTSPSEIAEVMTMREKAARLSRARAGTRDRKRSRAQDYMDGILTEGEENG